MFTIAPVTIKANNLSVYSPYNSFVAAPTCNGTATLINQTVEFCATDAGAATSSFHTGHLADAAGIGKLLGGANFSTCAVLSNSTSNSTSTNTTSTRSATVSTAAATSTSVAPVITSPAASPAPTAKNEAGSLAGSAAFAGLMALGALFL